MCIAVSSGRCPFAYGADRWFGRQMGQFSTARQITRRRRLDRCLVLLALAMVVVRVAATGVVTARAARRPAGALA